MPKFVSALKKLTRSRSLGPDDYDVHGVRDPFLQAALFRMLRVLARSGDVDPKLSDVLASVATNTDRAHNVGNALLLECVQTTLAVARTDEELRSMAVGVLGKFLTNVDNNVRFVALDICAVLVDEDAPVVQRYRDVFMECLHDADAAIRRKAIVLLYALVDTDSVRSVVRELLHALGSADAELRQELTHKLCFIADKYALYLHLPLSRAYVAGTRLHLHGTWTRCSKFSPRQASRTSFRNCASALPSLPSLTPQCAQPAHGARGTHARGTSARRAAHVVGAQGRAHAAAVVDRVCVVRRRVWGPPRCTVARRHRAGQRAGRRCHHAAW